MNTDTNSMKIGNYGLFGGLAGSFYNTDPLKPNLPKVFNCDTSRIITESDVAGSSWLWIRAVGGGSGGGGGALNTATGAGGAAGGGGGGGAGGYSEYEYPVDALVFPLYVIIGAGGLGGAGRTGTTGSGSASVSAGSTSIFASGIKGSSVSTHANTRISIAGGAGNWQTAGGGTTGQAGTAGQSINNNANYSWSWLGLPNGLAGGFPTPSLVGDSNSNWLLPRGGGGGGGIGTTDNAANGGRIKSNQGLYWATPGVNGADAPSFQYHFTSGWGGVGGTASLTDGQRGGNGWRGGGGGGGGAGRVSGGNGGNGGNGYAILVFS